VNVLLAAILFVLVELSAYGLQVGQGYILEPQQNLFRRERRYPGLIKVFAYSINHFFQYCAEFGSINQRAHDVLARNDKTGMSDWRPFAFQRDRVRPTSRTIDCPSHDPVPRCNLAHTTARLVCREALLFPGRTSCFR